MSYWTRVNLEIVDRDHTPLPVNEVLRVAESFIREVGWSVEDVRGDLRNGLEQGDTSFNELHCEHLSDLMQHISERFPEAKVAIRGVGEEFRDVWIREFRGGRVTFERGPYVDDEDPEEDDAPVDEPEPPGRKNWWPFGR